jgi:hypothetical protein
MNYLQWFLLLFMLTLLTLSVIGISSTLDQILKELKKNRND